MKKQVLFFGFLLISFTSLWADNPPSDLVIIVNPNTNPGTETDDVSIVFFDASGKRVYLDYTYDPITGKLIIKGATGMVFVNITNKKTNKTTSSKVVYTSNSGGN